MSLNNSTEKKEYSIHVSYLIKGRPGLNILKCANALSPEKGKVCQIIVSIFVPCCVHCFPEIINCNKLLLPMDVVRKIII